MNEEHVTEEPHFENIDADAVCEQCGTVNPEGTLLCKVCGNNLRDQRQTRISQDQGAFSGTGPSRIRIFTGVLTTLGILTVLLAAYSMPNIESWLVDIQSGNSGDYAAGLWSGPDSGIYDALLTELLETPSSRARMNGALENPMDDVFYNGRYALLGPSRIRGNNFIGEANLSRRGDRIYFVVHFLRNDFELRGYATLEGESKRPTVRNTAAVRIRGEEYPAFGYAEKREDGSLACYGQSFYDDGTHGTAAYRIP